MFLQKIKPLIQLKAGQNKSLLTAGVSTSLIEERRLTHQAFGPIVVLTLILWILYRTLFKFPVWFDETLGKAVFFGLPVWLYISITGFRPIIDTFSLKKFKNGLWRGLAFGGIYGFVVLLIRFLQSGWNFEPLPVFLAEGFWWEFLLAFFTAFWESIFFFSFVALVIKDRFPERSLIKKVILTTIIFLLFHIPHTFLNFSMTEVLPILFLLALFAVGQSLLFVERENAYTLVVSHAIWGMALLVYF